MRFLHDRWDEVQFAFRALGRQPWYAVTAAGTIALAVATTAAMTSIARSILDNPLPLPAPDRLIVVCETNPSIDRFCIGSAPNAFDWAAESKTVASIGVARDWSRTVVVEGKRRSVTAAIADGDWFTTLGIALIRGRAIGRDDLADARKVAVVSHQFWTTSLGARPDVIGSALILDDSSYTIIGVIAQGVRVPLLEATEVWTGPDFDLRAPDNRGWRGFRVVARLEKLVTVAQAESELTTIQRRLATRFPETNRDWGLRAVPLLEEVAGSARPALLAFLGATCLVALIALVNMTNLLIVRWWDRSRELAVRSALGGTAGRLTALVMTEGGALAAIGGGLGAIVAPWIVRAFVLVAPPSIPRLVEVNADPATILACAVGAMVTMVLIGLVPGRLTRPLDLANRLRGHAGDSGLSGRRRVRQALVIVEVALATMLVIGSGLLGRTFLNLTRWSPGFDRDHLLTSWILLPEATPARGGDTRVRFERLREAVAAVPGVAAVSQVSAGPVFGGVETGNFEVPGHSDQPLVARWFDAGPRYFGTLGAPLVRGRDLAATDRSGSALVAVVNESFARRLPPGRDPIGARIVWVDGSQRTEIEIIGVAADIQPWRVGSPTEPEVYWSFDQSPRLASYLVVRAAADPETVARGIDRRLAAEFPDVAAPALATWDALASKRLVGPRFNLLLVAGFGTLTVLVAGFGIYGVVNYLVVRRQREYGIRLALGADGRRVGRAILGEAAILAIVGAGTGLTAALAAARPLTPLLAGTSSNDPLTYLSAAGLLVTVGLTAAARPARRAASVDPIVVLRSE